MNKFIAIAFFLPLHRFICITFIGLAAWATIYENSLANMREMDDENISPSRQAIHPLHIAKTVKSINGQRIYPYENATIDLENTEPAIKLDKLHANNIINGCTFELHPISIIEHTNGNHLANNNRSMTVTPTAAVPVSDARGGFYRLNNNNANNINNNHHASNDDVINDNNHLKTHTRNGSTVYGRNALNTHTANHLSK